MEDDAQKAEARGFRSGVAVGIAATAALLHAGFSILVTPSLRSALAEFRAALPVVTRLAVSPAWSIAVPLLLLLSLAGATKVFVGNEARRFAALVTLSVIALGLFALTYWASYLPFTQLAGQIQVE